MVLSIFTMSKNQIGTLRQCSSCQTIVSDRTNEWTSEKRTNLSVWRGAPHKNDSIYGAVYFMPIIERNRANNNNNNNDDSEFRAYNNKCGAKHSASKRSTFFSLSVSISVSVSVFLSHCRSAVSVHFYVWVCVCGTIWVLSNFIASVWQWWRAYNKTQSQWLPVGMKNTKTNANDR